MFPYDDAKNLKTSISHGCDTVCLSYIVFMIESELIPMLNIVIRSAKVETLRKQVKDKDFVIPESVSSVLDKLATDITFPGQSFTTALPEPEQAFELDVVLYDNDVNLVKPEDDIDGENTTLTLRLRNQWIK